MNQQNFSLAMFNMNSIQKRNTKKTHYFMLPSEQESSDKESTVKDESSSVEELEDYQRSIIFRMAFQYFFFGNFKTSKSHSEIKRLLQKSKFWNCPNHDFFVNTHC